MLLIDAAVVQGRVAVLRLLIQIAAAQTQREGVRDGSNIP